MDNKFGLLLDDLLMIFSVFEPEPAGKYEYLDELYFSGRRDVSVLATVVALLTGTRFSSYKLDRFGLVSYELLYVD